MSADDQLFIYERHIEEFKRKCLPPASGGLPDTDCPAVLTNTPTDQAQCNADGFVEEGFRSSASITHGNTTGHDASSPTRLFVFDFDSTLFRSPLPNQALWSDALRGALMSDCGWFSEPRTLLSPYIPQTPGPEWWDSDVLSHVFSNLQRKDTVNVLLTGRRHDMFSERIRELCESHEPPLAFDLFFFREGHDINASRRHATTLDFKLAVLEYLLASIPSLSHIELFDDRKRHIDLFASEFKKLQSNKRISSFEVHHVTHAPVDMTHITEGHERKLVEDLVERCNNRIMAAKKREEEQFQEEAAQERVRRGSKDAGNTRSMRSPHKLQRRASASLFRNMLEMVEQVRYTALVLDESEQTRLRSMFPPPGPKWSSRADHVTICMGPSRPSLVDPMGGLGARVNVQAVAIGEIKNTVQALKVTAADQGSVLCTLNDTPHITLAVSPTGKARESNNIDIWEPLGNPVILQGTLREIHVTGLKMERGLSGLASAQLKKREVSIGGLVKKHHPGLHGRAIGLAVAAVEEWMAKTFIENLGQNSATIEWFVQGLDIQALVGSSIGDIKQTESPSASMASLNITSN
ncbi:hypothetical protein DFS34DRAFT_468711 [Phlyctochytrium arcticum]|nr:hypothetical protein DFS34DRAFT_468711 [Phlyctochytrium arcticum]